LSVLQRSPLAKESEAPRISPNDDHFTPTPPTNEKSRCGNSDRLDPDEKILILFYMKRSESTMRLYELSESMNQVDLMMQEGIEGLEDTLEAIQESFAIKAEGCIKLATSKKFEATAIKAEIDRLKKRAEKLEKDAEWLEGYVESQMLQTNMTEIKSSLFTLKLRMSPPSVVVDDANVIPTHYLRIVPATTAPDKNAIKDALKNGFEVPGARLMQSLKLNIK
jgi:hypothetical protein